MFSETQYQFCLHWAIRWRLLDVKSNWAFFMAYLGRLLCFSNAPIFSKELELFDWSNFRKVFWTKIECVLECGWSDEILLSFAYHAICAYFVSVWDYAVTGVLPSSHVGDEPPVPENFWRFRSKLTAPSDFRREPYFSKSSFPSYLFCRQSNCVMLGWASNSASIHGSGCAW